MIPSQVVIPTGPRREAGLTARALEGVLAVLVPLRAVKAPDEAEAVLAALRPPPVQEVCPDGVPDAVVPGGALHTALLGGTRARGPRRCRRAAAGSLPARRGWGWTWGGGLRETGARTSVD